MVPPHTDREIILSTFPPVKGIVRPQTIGFQAILPAMRTPPDIRTGLSIGDKSLYRSLRGFEC